MTFTDAEFLKVLRCFMEYSPAHWWLKNADGKYIFVNKQFAEFWQRTPEYFVGKTDFDFMTSMSAQSLRANDQSVAESQQSLHVHESIDGGDGERIFLIVKFPFNENGINYVGGIGFDVTEARRAQLDLEQARDHALESAALKSAFLSSVQHELRTPLSGIIGMNEILLMTTLSDEQREYAGIVQESSEAMLTVINDILDLSKLETGTLGLSRVPFSMRLVAQESVRLMAAAARKKNLALSLSFDYSIPELLIGDPERMRQLLLNVMGNAIKFTPKGSVEVLVSLIEIAQGCATVRFAIKDTGIGIAPDKQAYLFMPFWQADMSNTRVFGGPGLGLPVSKHLVEKMGGEGIHVESALESGSKFWFDIPFPLKDAVTIEPQKSDVLIVEDNSTISTAILKEFESLGIPAESVTSCHDAVNKIEQEPFRLLLSECMLEDGDATELIQRVRLLESSSGANKLPVVIMSANPSDSQRQRYLANGADDYVEKPLSTEQLWRLVNIWQRYK